MDSRLSASTSGRDAVKKKFKKAYRANQWVEETRAHAGSNVPDWHDESCGHTLLVGLVRKGQVRLGHTDRKIAEALLWV